MEKKLEKYNKKRDFAKTSEPKGKTNNRNPSESKLKFVIQHHIARKDHFDFRLEYKGVLLSWAVPKGSSFDPKDKRLAVHVEDHPLAYGNFEGTIPKGEYGGGTVMLWDSGIWLPYGNVDEGLKNGSIKFFLKGKRLVGGWTLVKLKNNADSKDNWLLIKENDKYANKSDILSYKTSIKTGFTMPQIEKGKIKSTRNTSSTSLLKQLGKVKADDEEITVGGIKITNPNKPMYENIKKIDIIKYYIEISKRMLSFLQKRIVSIVRCPKGENDACFFKKHPSVIGKGIVPVNIKNSQNETEEFFYIESVYGLIFEAQMGSIEFHNWSSSIDNLEKPDYMVFDLDPDEGLGLKQIRKGVKDLKSILDKLGLVSFLKTSGGKGYHVVVPFIPSVSWESFYLFAKNVAKLMEQTWQNLYTSSPRKVDRKNKIFIDAERNTRGSTTVLPYSLRARKNASVSMPIKWEELGKIAPDAINIKKAIIRLNKPDPWKDFFKVKQKLNS